MEKRSVDAHSRFFPEPGGKLDVELLSPDKRENFTLHVTRSRIKLTKATYVNRARQAIHLMRLDLDGPIHGNPDGQEIPCPHLRIYREGYADKCAVPAPADGYPEVSDLFSTFEGFMRHCNVTDPPRIEKRAILMSVAKIEVLLKGYREWLKEKTTLRRINGTWVEITTPYLDLHNDALQIYARRDNGGLFCRTTTTLFMTWNPRAVGWTAKRGRTCCE